MHRIQEFIHKFEVGEGVWALKLLVGLLALVALTAWYDLNEFQNFSNPEAMETAQLARNLASGHGYTTQCIRPLSLHVVGEHLGPEARLARQPHPDLLTPPVYPLLLAGLMKVLPFRYDIAAGFWMYPPEQIIALFNQALFFLTAFVVYRLARKLFDPSVATVTVIALLGSEVLWRFSVAGLSTHLLLLILVVLLWALSSIEEAHRVNLRTPRWFVFAAVGIGLLLAVGTLTRYSFGWLLLPVLGFVAAYLGARRTLVGGLILVVFLVAVAPWLARNYALSGRLFGLASYALYADTMPFPNDRLERSLKPELDRVEMRDVVRKFLGNAAQIAHEELPKLGGGSWLASFFLAGLFLPFRNVGLSRLRLFLLAGVVTLGIAQALGRTHLTREAPLVNGENLLVLFMPAIFIYGVAFYYVLLDQMKLPFLELRPVVTGLFAAVACLPLLSRFLPPRSYPIVYPPYLPPWIQEAARFMRPDELMMSDMPWAVAWYGDRACVWTTLDTTGSFYEIHDYQKPISALYLTPLTTDARFLTQILQGPDFEWSRFAVSVLMQTNLPPRFPLRDARTRYTPDQILLCDRARWMEKGR